MSKSLILLTGLLLAGSATAQTALTPSSPALTVSGTVVDTSAVLGASETVPDTNMTAAAAAAWLQNLQFVVEQALPAIAAFNDNFDFVNTAAGTVQGASTGGISTPVQTSANAQTRDTLRTMLIIQNDLRRMLPLLNTLNGGNGTNSVNGATNLLPGIPLTRGLFPGTFTNLFGP